MRNPGLQVQMPSRHAAFSSAQMSPRKHVAFRESFGSNRMYQMIITNSVFNINKLSKLLVHIEKSKYCLKIYLKITIHMQKVRK